MVWTQYYNFSSFQRLLQKVICSALLILHMVTTYV